MAIDKFISRSLTRLSVAAWRERLAAAGAVVIFAYGINFTGAKVLAIIGAGLALAFLRREILKRPPTFEDAAKYIDAYYRLKNRTLSYLNSKGEEANFIASQLEKLLSGAKVPPSLPIAKRAKHSFVLALIFAISCYLLTPRVLIDSDLKEDLKSKIEELKKVPELPQNIQIKLEKFTTALDTGLTAEEASEKLNEISAAIENELTTDSKTSPQLPTTPPPADEHTNPTPPPSKQSEPPTPTPTPAPKNDQEKKDQQKKSDQEKKDNQEKQDKQEEKEQQNQQNQSEQNEQKKNDQQNKDQKNDQNNEQQRSKQEQKSEEQQSKDADTQNSQQDQENQKDQQGDKKKNESSNNGGQSQSQDQSSNSGKPQQGNSEGQGNGEKKESSQDGKGEGESNSPQSGGNTSPADSKDNQQQQANEAGQSGQSGQSEKGDQKEQSDSKAKDSGKSKNGKGEALNKAKDAVGKMKDELAKKSAEAGEKKGQTGEKQGEQPTGKKDGKRAGDSSKEASKKSGAKPGESSSNENKDGKDQSDNSKEAQKSSGGKGGAAKRFSENGETEGYGGERGFSNQVIGDTNEKYDERFAKSTGEKITAKDSPGSKLNISETALSELKAREGDKKIKIPLEYKEQLK